VAELRNRTGQAAGELLGFIKKEEYTSVRSPQPECGGARALLDRALVREKRYRGAEE
jgi:hypothetical protein